MAATDLSRWSDCARLPLPRAHCAAGVRGGKILVAGGTTWTGGEKFWSDRADLYDPATDRWESLPALPYRHGEGAGLAGDDAISIVGGSTNGALSADAWTFRGGAWAPDPALVLPEPRRCPAVARVGDTHYVIGGFAGATGEDAATRTVWARSPATPRWEERAPLPGPGRFWAGAAVLAGQILLAGGATWTGGAVANLDEIIAYDPGADRWTVVGRLPEACRGAGCVAGGNELLILGGYAEDFGREILGFDPGTGRIRRAGALPRPLAFSSFLRLGGRVYAVGGEDGDRQRADWTPVAAGP